MFTVEVTPMQSHITVNQTWGGEFTNRNEAVAEFTRLCAELNLDNVTSSYSGKEAGGRGYDYRISLLIIED